MEIIWQNRVVACRERDETLKDLLQISFANVDLLAPEKNTFGG